MSKIRFYLGTYTEPILFGTGELFQGKGKGIYRLLLDPQSGALSFEGEPAPSLNPSFVCLSPDQRFLYAVNELKIWEGKAGGGVSAYRVEADGSLTFLNARPTGGTDPCHVIVNAAQTHVYVSNFMSGSVSVYPIRDDGSLGEMSDFHQYEGSGPVTARQKGPHAHSLTFSPDQRFAFVPDLGTDRLMAYRTDFENGKLPAADAPFVKLFGGSGPRYGEFHPNGRFFYLINEIASSISLFHFDAASGQLSLEQTVDTIPEEAKKASGNICADLHITPDGRFLYGSNRGHNSLTAYRIDPENGRLTEIANIPCGGRTPRNFCIESGGRYLICGLQDSDNITVFAIDPESGALQLVYDLPAPSPVCIREVR